MVTPDPSASCVWVSLHPCPFPARSLGRSVVGWVRPCKHILYYMSLFGSYVVGLVVVHVFGWVCVLFGGSVAFVVVSLVACSILCGFFGGVCVAWQSVRLIFSKIAFLILSALYVPSHVCWFCVGLCICFVCCFISVVLATLRPFLIGHLFNISATSPTCSEWLGFVVLCGVALVWLVSASLLGSLASPYTHLIFARFVVCGSWVSFVGSSVVFSLWWLWLLWCL